MQLSSESFIKKDSRLAIVVGIQKENTEFKEIHEQLEEMGALLKTLGIQVFQNICQRRLKLSPNLLIGAGKAQEIKDLVSIHQVPLVVIDHALSAPQVRNLEELIGCQVLDRTGVILEIFAKHAQTMQAKTQVEIARLEYILPRLSGMWTHFQKQQGGGIHSRGMGETQIEVDRRHARERISRLKTRLLQIKKEKEVQSKARKNELKVALIGYTNSGKTTWMHRLTKDEADGKNELFATLDARIRTIDPTTRPKILLTDTVGFIKSLPPTLIESFHSTLGEVRNANLLLHVVDLANENYMQQIATTKEVLEAIGAGDIPSILIFNKKDQVDDALLPKIMLKKFPGSLFVTAFDKNDILRVREHIFESFNTRFHKAEITVLTTDSEALSSVFRSCIILDADYSNEGQVTFQVKSPKEVLEKLTPHILRQKYAQN